MSETTDKRGIQDSWSLLAFARMKGLPRPNSGTNKETGKTFHNLAFEHPTTGALTFVSFSQNLGVLSTDEILARKNNLQVVKLNPDPTTGKDGGYLLCKAGNLNLGEAINLFGDDEEEIF